MIRRYALCLLIISVTSFAHAQQLTQYTQYVFNHFSVNPAVAGSRDCIDVRLGVRQQWVGFDGAPRTGWASLHGTLGKKRGFNRNKHGVGAFVEADNAGNWGYTRFLLAYAYHLQMMQDTYLAFGAFAGAQQMKFDRGNVFAIDYTDPALAGNASSLVVPDITPGIWWYNKRSWAGVSLHNALANRIGDVGEEARLSRHFMISGGHRLILGQKMAVIPSALIKKSGASPFAIDINAMAEWNRTLSIGVGLRGGDALNLMLKLKFLGSFQLGYSYDITTSRLRAVSSNTHEIILGITPCGKESDGRRMISCPAFE